MVKITTPIPKTFPKTPTPTIKIAHASLSDALGIDLITFI